MRSDDEADASREGRANGRKSGLERKDLREGDVLPWPSLYLRGCMLFEAPPVRTTDDRAGEAAIVVPPRVGWYHARQVRPAHVISGSHLAPSSAKDPTVWSGGVSR